MNLKVINKYISVSNASTNGSGELYIYGDIADEKWWDDDVTPKSIMDSLNTLGSVKNIDIHINSCGGSCIAGNAIISILDSYKRKNNATLNVYIEGIAASMGSGIASVGDKVYMADNALYMVHRPLAGSYGNADDMQKTIDLLEKVEETLVANYMRKFKGTEDELRQLLADETWLSADEAKEYGFVDEIVTGVKVAASAKGIKIGEQVFENKVANMIKNKYPNMKIEKEVKALNYDKKLKDFGIDEESFENFNIESDVLMNIASKVKDSIKPEPVEQFVDKAYAINALGCEDITSEQLIDYAKAGMNHKDTTEITNKANAYDNIVSSAKEDALIWAIKAQGDSYNESRMKKFLDVLDYSEIVAQTNSWKEEAKVLLNAGKRVSTPEGQVENHKSINVNDYKV